MKTQRTPLRLSKEVHTSKIDYMIDVFETKDGQIKNSLYRLVKDAPLKNLFRTWEGVPKESLPLVPAKVVKEAAKLIKKAEQEMAKARET